MPFSYLYSRISDPYVVDELKKWSEYLKNGVPCTGHRVETLTRTRTIRIRTDNVTLSMSQDQAIQLSKDLQSVVIEKTIKERRIG